MSRTQLEAARRMLRELSDLAESSSLTGSLRGGAGHATERYNAILHTLEEESVVPEGMFTALNPESTEFGQLAVDTRLLLASIQMPDDDEEDDDDDDRRHGHGRHHGPGDHRGMGALIALAPFLDREDLAKMVRERLEESGPIKDGLLIALAPFLDKAMLGDLVNRRMRPEPPKAPAPPTPPTPPSPAVAPAPIAEPSREIVAAESRLPEIAPNEELAKLATKLADPALTVEERSAIAVRLSELALQQGQMAQEGP